MNHDSGVVHRLESLFLSALPEITRAARVIARRYKLARAEEEDLASDTKVALLANGYAALARFEGRCSLRTYLVTLIHRRLLDERRRLWGKWRPSAIARRGGPLALQLEELILRDGLSVESALDVLCRHPDGAARRQELADIARRLRPRAPRRTAGSDSIKDLPASAHLSPDVALESMDIADRAQRVITTVMGSLPAEDRVIVRLRFEDGMSVADIARLQARAQRPLYRRLERLLGHLRREFESQGLHWSELQTLIERGHCHLSLSPIAHRREAMTTTEEPR